jgi:hypothetical protein
MDQSGAIQLRTVSRSQFNNGYANDPRVTKVGVSSAAECNPPQPTATPTSALLPPASVASSLPPQAPAAPQAASVPPAIEVSGVQTTPEAEPEARPRAEEELAGEAAPEPDRAPQVARAEVQAAPAPRPVAQVPRPAVIPSTGEPVDAQEDRLMAPLALAALFILGVGLRRAAQRAR